MANEHCYSEEDSLTTALAAGSASNDAFCIVFQASIALCLSIRLRVIGTGGRVGTQLEVRTQNNTLCNRKRVLTDTP